MAERIMIKGRIFVKGSLRRTCITIEDGRVIAVGPTEGVKVIVELPNRYIILPGFIDMHVHLRDFELSYKEDVVSGTHAALAGGVVAVGDMPNTRPPINNVERLQEKVRLFSKRSPLHIRHYFGVPDDLGEIRHAREAGAYAIGEILPEDIAEKGDQFLESLIETAAKAEMPVILHCEDPLILSRYEGPRGFEYHNVIRSPKAELSCVLNAIKMAYRYNAWIHITHITLPQSVELIRRFQNEVKITFDVTPHHLLLSQEVCLERAERPGYCKVNPPLRNEEARRGLFSMFIAGLIDIVASDHAPHAPWEKEEDYDGTPPGIPGLETTAPLLLTLWKRGLIDLGTVVRTYHTNPAKFLSLKVGLEEGGCADFVIVDLKAKRKIDPSKFKSKAKYTPFKGIEVEAFPVITVLHGKVAYVDEELVDRGVAKSLIERLGEIGF